MKRRHRGRTLTMAARDVKRSRVSFECPVCRDSGSPLDGRLGVEALPGQDAAGRSGFQQAAAGGLRNDLANRQYHLNDAQRLARPKHRERPSGRRLKKPDRPPPETDRCSLAGPPRQPHGGPLLADGQPPMANLLGTRRKNQTAKIRACPLALRLTGCSHFLLRRCVIGKIGVRKNRGQAPIRGYGNSRCFSTTLSHEMVPDPLRAPPACNNPLLPRV